LYELSKEFKRNGIYFDFKHNNNSISQINTLTKTYSLTNDFKEAKREYEEEYGFSDYKIDSIIDKEVSNFVKEGTHYPSTITFFDPPNDEEDRIILSQKLKHIDQTTSYASFKHSKYYLGFLGKITDFRPTNKIQGVGIYRIDNINISEANQKILEINKHLDILHNKCPYALPFLKFFDEMNITYDILEGCWGVKEFHFEFPDYMLEKEEDIPHYSRWSGLCDSHSNTTSKSFYGSEELCQLIRNNIVSSKFRVRDDVPGHIEVVYPKKTNFHLGHITSFITSYCALNTIEQLMIMEPSKVFKVNMDGIYYLEHDFTIKQPFRVKEGKELGGPVAERFLNIYPEELNQKLSSNFPRENHRTELHTGAGGCGKTHKQLTHTGLVRKSFIAPSWKLARNKESEYSCRCSVRVRVRVRVRV
ncbi:unnamed protein product, partial [Phaeothamnion confervicola]